MPEGFTARLNELADRADERQRSVGPAAVVVAVVKKFGDDRGSHLAKLLAYSGFFSMFPLMLASVSVIGLVLKDDPELQKKMIDSALSSIPVLGTSISETSAFDGSGLVLVLSILLAFWAGLGLLDMIQEALNTVWNVPRFERPGWIPRRARAMGGVLLLLLCAGLSGVGSYVLASGLAEPFRSVITAMFPLSAGFIASVGIHKILCARNLRFVDLVPGAIATAVGWWALFSLGNFYFNRVVKNASDTYGAFAVVLGLLSWSFLLGTMFVYATEISAVLSDRLWPRSLTGRNLGEADQRALRLMATKALTVEAAQVTVEMPDGGGEPADAGVS